MGVGPGVSKDPWAGIIESPILLQQGWGMGIADGINKHTTGEIRTYNLMHGYIEH